MLTIEGLTKRFGPVTAVAGVSLEIPAGQMVGVIGRSGAGKSTLLRMINRLESPSEGRIAFSGRAVSSLRGGSLRAWQRDCAMIFQQFNLVPRLDVLTNVMLGRLNRRSTLKSLLGIFSDDERARALLALERLGIAQTATQRAQTLSGGQQQRVAIARALVQEPTVVLADEPIASLDPMNAEIVMRSLREINERDGLTVVCNLHTLDTARTYCDRVVGMLAGRVVFDGPASELTNDKVREVYGVEGEAELSEAVTSTAMPGAAAMPGSTASPPVTADVPHAVPDLEYGVAPIGTAPLPPRRAARLRERQREVAVAS